MTQPGQLVLKVVQQGFVKTGARESCTAGGCDSKVCFHACRIGYVTERLGLSQTPAMPIPRHFVSDIAHTATTFLS